MLDLTELYDDEPIDDPANVTEGSSDDNDDTSIVTQDNEDDETSTTQPPTTDDEDAKAYFEYLKQVQILDVPEDFEFENNADSIQKALEITRNNLTAKVAQQFWNRLPDDFKPLFQYGLSGGKNIQEYLAATASVEVEDLDINDPISQKSVIRSYYRLVNPKLSEEQVDKRIDRLEEIADLEEEAKDAIEYLKTHKKEQTEALIRQTQDQEKARLDAAKQELETYSKLIEEDKEFDALRKSRLKSFLFSPINNSTGFENALDSIYDNPQHKIQLANILADYDPKIGFNFEKIQKKLEKQATRSVKEMLNKNVDAKQKLPSATTSGKEDFDWQSWNNYFNK